MYIFTFLFKLSTFSHIWSTAAAAQGLSGSKFYSVNCFNLRPTKWKTLSKAKRIFTILLKSLCCWCTHWDEQSQDQCDPKQFYLSNHLLNINNVPSERDTLSPLSYSMSFIQSACSVQNFPLLLCLFLCFRLSLHFHCVTSSSFFSPHFPSAHPSLVFLPDYKHVVIPLIAVSSICFSFSSSTCSSWFLSLFSPLVSAFFFFLLHVTTTFFLTRLINFFSHSHLAFCHFFSSAFLTHLLLLNPPTVSIHHFSLCNFPSHSRLLFPFILLFPLGSTSPSIPPYAHHPPPTCHHNMIFTGSLSSTFIDLSCPIPTRLFQFFLFPLIIIHQYLLIFYSGFLLLCSHPPTPLPFPPHLSIIMSNFDIFSYSDLITVFTHQTVFMLLSLCHVIFLIVSPCCSSFHISSFLASSTLAILLSHNYVMVYVHNDKYRWNMFKRQCNTMIILKKFAKTVIAVQKKHGLAIFSSDHLITRQQGTLNKSHMGSQHVAC